MADVHGSPAAAPQGGVAGSIQAPYDPGSVSPIDAMGDADAGGRDTVAGTTAGAVAAALARAAEHQGDTYGQGSRIGDFLHMPPSPLDPGTGSLGGTDPSGAYYDPPRNYGGQ